MVAHCKVILCFTEREREREREGGGERERERERGGEREREREFRNVIAFASNVGLCLRIRMRPRK